MHRHICVYMHWGVCEAAQTQAADKSTDKHACMHMYIGIPSRVRVDIYVQGNEYWHVQACVPIFVPANCAQVHVQTGTCRFPQANGPIAAQPSGCCEGGGGHIHVPLFVCGLVAPTGLQVGQPRPQTFRTTGRSCLNFSGCSSDYRAQRGVALNHNGEEGGLGAAPRLMAPG